MTEPEDYDSDYGIGCFASGATVAIALALGMLLVAGCPEAHGEILIVPPAIAIRSPVAIVPRPVVYAPPVVVAPPHPLPLPPRVWQDDVPTNLPVGSVLLSRNWDERENTSVGYWNHTCVVVGNDHIVEAQEPGVIYTPLAAYWMRPYSRILIFRPWSEYAGEIAAHRAQMLVGRPYAPLSSVVSVWNGPFRQRLGLNCVSVVEIAYCLPAINNPDGMFAVQSRMFYPPEKLR